MTYPLFTSVERGQGVSSFGRDYDLAYFVGSVVIPGGDPCNT